MYVSHQAKHAATLAPNAHGVPFERYCAHKNVEQKRKKVQIIWALATKEKKRAKKVSKAKKRQNKCVAGREKHENDGIDKKHTNTMQHNDNCYSNE